MQRVIIIDDEIKCQNVLTFHIDRFASNLRVVATTTDASAGITMIEDYRPDVVFLDISMPNLNGFQLLDRLKFRDFKLVFTTAHEEFALKAIKERAFDYLLKPIDSEDFVRCIENLSAQTTNKLDFDTAGIIELSVRDGIIFIKPDDIIRLEASGSYTNIYLQDGIRHVASKSLKEFEPILNSPQFYRCHNSNIVNLFRVKKLISKDGLFAQMDDGSMPEISKKNKETFVQRLKSLG
jgi:two-component system LytT family response regulator